MSTPIEALAQECAQARVDESNPISPHTTFSDVVYGFKEGAKAASGQGEARIKELEDGLRRIYNAVAITSWNENELYRDWSKQMNLIIKEALSGAGKGEGHG